MRRHPQRMKVNSERKTEKKLKDRERDGKRRDTQSNSRWKK